MNASKILVRYLVQSGFLSTQPDVNTYESQLSGPLACLENNKICSQSAALQFLSQKLGLALVNPSKFAETDNWNPEQFTKVIGNEFCWQHRVLPYREDAHTIFVASVNPFQDDTKQLLEFYLQKPVTLELINEAQLKSALHKYAPQDTNQTEQSQHTSSASVIDIVDTDRGVDNDEAQASSQPIIQLCNKIIAEAIERSASDIHIEPSDNGLDIRIRVLGSMARISSIPKNMQPYVLTRFKLMARMDISERRKPQDGRLRAKINNKVVDIRVSSIPTAHGEKIVMRLLSGSAANKDLSKLGIPTHINNELINTLQGRGRMLLVTGPTGSGKSTTLYACLQNILNSDLNIVTVEDPIEYRVRGINQIQVDEPAGVTFASALRSILRQDPDVIMIGEIRDLETATIAVQAAQTGHLVLSTLHTNDAPSAIRRLEQLGVPNFQIAASLAGVVAQRLVRTLCPKCATKLNQSEFEKACKLIEKQGVQQLPNELMKNVGCSECFNSGFTGRTGVYSYIKVDQELESLICDKAPVGDLVKSASKNNYTSLKAGALELLYSGQTTLEEVLPIIISDHTDTIKQNSANTFVSTQVAVPLKADKLTKKKIMVVEDDSNLRQVLSMLLEKEMFEVIQAENGQDAIEKLYTELPQVILCDLMMPVMDGKEFLKRLKNNQQTSQIPIVMLTAADDESNEVDLLSLGANDFVSKTSSTNIMITRVRKHTSSL